MEGSKSVKDFSNSSETQPKMTTTTSVKIDYVLVIEWLEPTDKETGKDLCAWLQERDMPVKYVACNSATDVQKSLKDAAKCLQADGVPVVHIESHGDPRSVPVNDRAFGTSQGEIRWSDLGDWMSPLNEASEFNILLVSASCWGLNALRAFHVHKPAPFMGCVGFKTEVGPSSLKGAMIELYRSLLNGSDLRLAALAAKRELRSADEDLVFRSSGEFAQGIAVDACKSVLIWGTSLCEEKIRKIWGEWFPPTVQAQFAEYAFNWPGIHSAAIAGSAPEIN